MVFKKEEKTPNEIMRQEMLKKTTQVNFRNPRNLIEKTPKTESRHAYEDLEELMIKQREENLKALTTSSKIDINKKLKMKTNIQSSQVSKETNDEYLEILGDEEIDINTNIQNSQVTKETNNENLEVLSDEEIMKHK